MGKRAGLKYSMDEVIDHLYKPNQPRGKSAQTQFKSRQTDSQPLRDSGQTGVGPVADSSQIRAEQPLRQRLGALLADSLDGLTSSVEDSPYVEEDIPEYLQDAARDIPKDEEPGGDWSEVKDEEYVLTASDFRLIEENMGTYLSVVGMTLEILDPYCGAILGNNLDNMVKRWSKVVARYPSASRLFLAKGGGAVMDWIAALQATWPFLYALYEHHLAGTVKTDRGRVYRVSQNGSAPMPDGTSPVMDYDYTTN